MEQYLDYVWFDPEDWGVEVEVDMSQGEWARWMLDRFNGVYPIHDNATFLEAVYDWAHRTSVRLLVAHLFSIGEVYSRINL